MKDFDPARVPAGTIQDMAKRLSKHSEMTDVSLSKCQEVMARTFGHASLHALKTQKHASLAGEAILCPGIRMQLYSLMSMSLEAKLSLPYTLEKIELMAQRGSQWPLRDLAQALQGELRAGKTLSQAMAEFSNGDIPMELFLLETLEPQGNLERAAKECLKLAEKASDAIDYARLRGELP